jgi:CRP-like cAMP-binding protein
MTRQKNSPQQVIPHAQSPEVPRPALFEGMSDKDVRAMLSYATVLDYPAQSWIYRQGDPAREVFLLQSGLVRLIQLTAEGNIVLVRFIAPGGAFGHLSLALGGMNVVSAQAIRLSSVAVWNQKTALQLLHTFPRAALNLFTIASYDVAYLYDYIRRLAIESVGQRVEWALADLAHTIGICTPQGVVISLDIGQRDIAELAGTNIFTVNRELKKLELQGLLKTGRKHLLVLQPSRLLALLPKS